MKFGMAAASGLLLCAACSEPKFVDAPRRDGGGVTMAAEPDSSADAGHRDASVVDAGSIEAGMPAVPGRTSTPSVGMLGSGGGVRVGKTLQVADDGFENQGRRCGQKLCAEGGIIP